MLGTSSGTTRRDRASADTPALVPRSRIRGIALFSPRNRARGGSLAAEIRHIRRCGMARRSSDTGDLTTEPEATERRLRRAAEREADNGGPPAVRRTERGKSDAEAAEAHTVVGKLKHGRPPLKDTRDRPVEGEADKDITEGGIDGARRARGR